MKLGIRTKLILLMTLLAVAIGATISFIVYQNIRRELIAGEERSLHTTRQTLTASVSDVFKRYQANIATQSQAPTTIEAFDAFSSGWKRLNGELISKAAETPEQLQKMRALNIEKYRLAYKPMMEEDKNTLLPGAPISPEGIMLQYIYITANPAPFGNKSLNNLPTEADLKELQLDQDIKDAYKASSYAAAHGKFHAYFQDYAKANEVDDVLMLNLDGNVIYSMAKRFDFASGVAETPTGLGQAFTAAMDEEVVAKANVTDRVAFSDIVLYRPGFDAATTFAATPILQDGKPVGVLAFAINTQILTRLLYGELTGSERGTEAYLIGEDGTLRSESAFIGDLAERGTSNVRPFFGGNSDLLAQTAIMKLSVGKDRANTILTGYLSEEYQNYLGKRVLGSAAKLPDIGVQRAEPTEEEAAKGKKPELSTLKLAIVTESDMAQIVAPVERMAKVIIGISLGAAGLALLLAIFAGNTFTRPLVALGKTAVQVAQGDLKARAPVLSNDEVGQLAHQFNAMLEDIRQKTEQTNRIMATVKEGLLLIDHEHIIQPQYSKECEAIFQKGLAGQSLIEIIKPYVAEKDISVAKDYIELLFSGRVKEKLIEQTNPLTEVELRVDDGRGGFRSKVLEFRFSRVHDETGIHQVMVTVMDVTARVMLTREIKEAEKKAHSQAELLFGIMHVEPATLREFLANTKNLLEDASFYLKNEQNKIQPGETMRERQGRYIDLVANIRRPIHLIKGNAAMLRIGFFEDRAHTFEDSLQRVSNRNPITGEDFVPITLQLGDMINLVQSTIEVISRVAQINSAFTNSARNSSALQTAPNKSSVAEQITTFTHEIADRVGKKTSLRIHEDFEQIVPVHDQYKLQEIITQLLRNAVVHGIEPAAERIDNNKPPAGIIRLDVRPHDECSYTIEITDDGRGLDYEAIRQKARELGYKSTDTWGVQQLTEVIFAPGFSTAQQVTKDAVLDRVLAMNGTISVANRPGKSCTFVLSFDRTLTNK